jgi:cyanophycin synthetase
VIIEQGEMLGRAYDRVVIYEDTELRGRPEGTIFRLVREGLQRGGRTREVMDVRGNLNAIEVALIGLRPGELLVIQPEFPDAGAEYFARLVKAGARELTMAQALAMAVQLPVDAG